MFLSRRAMVGLLPAAMMFTAHAAEKAPVPPNGKLAFTVWRKGSKVGTHVVTFQQAGDVMTVETNLRLAVGVGPITFYRYTYHVMETWKAGQLDGLVAATNDDGTKSTCNARRNGDRLMVDGSKSGVYEAPPGSIAGTHWNKAEIDAKIINPESGILMSFVVVDKGVDAPPDGIGTAHRYGLTGFGTVDLWWDDKGTWVGLRGVAPKDKSIIEYRRA